MRGAIAKWGNSLALRLPHGLARDAGLYEGASVDIVLEGGRLVVSRIRPRYALDELMADYRPDHRHGETDW